MKTMMIAAALASLVSTAAFAEPSAQDWSRMHSQRPAAAMSYTPKGAEHVAPVRLKKMIRTGDQGQSHRYDPTTWDADENNG